MKRFFDLIFGSLAALILFVPVLLEAIDVRLTSKGPFLYWSDRVGRNNAIFMTQAEPRSSTVTILVLIKYSLAKQ